MWVHGQGCVVCTYVHVRTREGWALKNLLFLWLEKILVILCFFSACVRTYARTRTHASNVFNIRPVY